ncbi:PhzF family phenazine biosynthesis protein [Robertmurraya korlensis]|uniref:PhzF family phenazine biosynthesis protein n=1 Tax=Robertmurraya korlensis TaxID=519977 RepID=UPI0008261607|nr:PhzF family phenazine biosynthesis protein [Robertmurraya korlensis]
MKKIIAFHYDVFSKEVNKGNPAGVVMETGLSTEEMQQIALEIGFNETSFPVLSDKADLQIRYFTPGHEMNLCGHGTMATIYALKTKGLLGDKEELTIETKAGILPIRIQSSTNGDISITMKQAPPQFLKFTGSRKELAASIGLTEDDIETELPILYGSTGTWTLLVPIKKLAEFKRMKPNNQMFPSVLQDLPTSSVHPFCLETYDQNAHMHARHFSSPFSGTIEDPVTGTGSGVMGAYYARYIKNRPTQPLTLIVEQGQEIDKDGRVVVTVSNNDIEITGQAVFVKELKVTI